MSQQDGKTHSGTETYSHDGAIGANIDLRTVRGGYATEQAPEAKCPKELIVWNVGDLQVEYPTGIQDTIPVTVPGVKITSQPAKIIAAGTTITKFTATYN